MDEFWKEESSVFPPGGIRSLEATLLLKRSNQTTSSSHLLPDAWIPADVVSHPQLQVAHAGHRVKNPAGLRCVEGIEIDLPLRVDQRPQGHRLYSHLLHPGEEVNAARARYTSAHSNTGLVFWLNESHSVLGFF